MARITRTLPNFRGKVRLLLTLHRALGLRGKHIVLDATLGRPVRYDMSLDLNCAHERMAFLMNEYESDTTQFLLRLHDGHGALWDIGANVGLITIPFAIQADSALTRPVVYAIEAVGSNVAALRENLGRNGLNGDVTVVPFGVGDTEKSVDIQVEGNLPAGAGTGTANILSDKTDYVCERIPLKITTLDRLVERSLLGADVGVIKLDLDGYDLFALLGGAQTLSKARPVVFGEFMAHCLEWHGQKVGDVVVFMRTLQYRTFARCHPHWVFEENFNHDSYSSDLLLVPEEKVDQFAWCLRAAA